jgi:hypothetical protein
VNEGFKRTFEWWAPDRQGSSAAVEAALYRIARRRRSRTGRDSPFGAHPWPTAANPCNAAVAPSNASIEPKESDMLRALRIAITAVGFLAASSAQAVTFTYG